jgi:hypothetical protein
VKVEQGGGVEGGVFKPGLNGVGLGLTGLECDVIPLAEVVCVMMVEGGGRWGFCSRE